MKHPLERQYKNTKVVVEGSTTKVILHETAIVVFTAKKITLDTGGWNTLLTRKRMMEVSQEFGLGFRVWTLNKVFHIQAANGEVWKLADGDKKTSITFPR